MPRPLEAQDDAPVELEVTRQTIEVNGRAASVYRLGRAAGTPGLELPAGRFRVRLTNRSAEATLVHWHGLLSPYGQDGVPDFPQPPLPPGQTYSYDFALDTPGTHWMHAHTLQEQELLAAPLIVTDPAEVGRDEQPVVVLFHDFSFRSPEELLAGLKASRGHGGATVGHAMGGQSMAGMPEHNTQGMMSMGAGAAGRMGADHDGGDASDMDLDDINDIDYDAYLANDRTLDDPAVFRVERSGIVRMRLINDESASTAASGIGLGPDRACSAAGFGRGARASAAEWAEDFGSIEAMGTEPQPRSGPSRSGRCPWPSKPRSVSRSCGPVHCCTGNGDRRPIPPTEEECATMFATRSVIVRAMRGSTREKSIPSLRAARQRPGSVQWRSERKHHEAAA